jgi:hypothetical protein
VRAAAGLGAVRSRRGAERAQASGPERLVAARAQTPGEHRSWAERCSRLWWPRSITRKMRETVAWNALLVFQACVLGLPCKVKFDSDRPPLTRIETAYSFCHIE